MAHFNRGNKWLISFTVILGGFRNLLVKILFQKILKKNITEDLKVNRIRYKVRVASNEESSTCYLLLSAQERIYAKFSGRTEGGPNGRLSDRPTSDFKHWFLV